MRLNNSKKEASNHKPQASAKPKIPKAEQGTFFRGLLFEASLKLEA